jgi:hypothetical protein
LVVIVLIDPHPWSTRWNPNFVGQQLSAPQDPPSIRAHAPAGLSGARDEFHLAAIVRNLKTLAKHIWRPRPQVLPPACKVGSTHSSSASIFFTTRVAKILTLAARHRGPVALAEHEDAAADWLMSHGSNTLDLYRQIYSGRILKGEKPADLPVQQASKYELFINLKTRGRSTSPSRKPCWPPPMR